MHVLANEQRLGTIEKQHQARRTDSPKEVRPAFAVADAPFLDHCTDTTESYDDSSDIRNRGSSRSFTRDRPSSDYRMIETPGLGLVSRSYDLPSRR